MKILIKIGGTSIIDFKDHMGNTPLHIASSNGHRFFFNKFII